jgi:translation initiation factor 1A
MPKKDKRCKNNHRGASDEKELVLADEGQTYGNVSKSLGNRWFDVQCQDGVLRKCQVRGNMRNKKYVNVGDVVIVSLRDFQDNKGDIIHVYNGEETRTLKNTGELLMDVKIIETEETEESGFDFENI